MKPIRVVARLSSPIVAGDALHLDALLQAAVARRDGLLPLTSQAAALNAPDLEIPIERSSCGRYYLCTTMLGNVVAREKSFIIRRFPVAQAVAFAEPKLRRINLSTGPTKNIRIPIELCHVDTPTWYAIGDPERVRELLTWITGLGRRRAVGHGAVISWTVEPHDDPWPGFPVLGPDGEALRNLPLDTPGLGLHVPRFGNLRPPYWLRATEEPIAARVA